MSSSFLFFLVLVLQIIWSSLTLTPQNLVALRKQFAHAIVNAGFRCQISPIVRIFSLALTLFPLTFAHPLFFLLSSRPCVLNHSLQLFMVELKATLSVVLKLVFFSSFFLFFSFFFNFFEFLINHQNNFKEKMLINKIWTAPGLLQSALDSLQQELTVDPSMGRDDYRKSLINCYFYKYYLHAIEVARPGEITLLEDPKNI